MRISDWSSDVCSSDLRRGYENFIGERLGVYGALRRDEDNRVSARDAYVQADWQPADGWRIKQGVRHSEVRFTSDDRYITADKPDERGRLRYSRSSPVAGVLFHATPEGGSLAHSGDGQSAIGEEVGTQE